MRRKEGLDRPWQHLHLTEQRRAVSPGKAAGSRSSKGWWRADSTGLCWRGRPRSGGRPTPKFPYNRQEQGSRAGGEWPPCLSAPVVGLGKGAQPLHCRAVIFAHTCLPMSTSEPREARRPRRRLGRLPTLHLILAIINCCGHPHPTLWEDER